MPGHERTAGLVVCLLGLVLPRASAKSGFCHMYYINADTNLERYQINDMQEVLEMNHNQFTGLMYMDRNNAETSSTSNAMSNLYYDDGRQTTKEIPTTIYAKWKRTSYSNGWFIQKQPAGELDTTKVSTVLDFARWAWSACDGPDQYKIFSFNMHGGGVAGVSGDDSNGHSSLSIPELQQIFETLAKENKRFDLIGFDTCLMSAYSLAQVLWPLADFLVASEPIEPGYGWAYDKINTQSPTAMAYGQSIIDGYLSQGSGPNELVMTDLAKFGKVIQPARALMVKMTDGLKAGDQGLSNSIEKARANTAEYEAVWETFVDWFDISDRSGAKEKSQADFGNFLRNLKQQCHGFAPEIDQILPLLESSVNWKKKSSSLVVCTGPQCAAGTEGMALWFKKKRWMTGAYQHYAKVWRTSVDRAVQATGPFVDERLEKELKEGLPEWSEFLEAHYLFKAKSGAPSTCAGASGPPSSSSTRRRQTSNNLPAPAACPSDGKHCSPDAACTCTAGYSQQKYQTGSGFCYGCEGSSTPTPYTCTSGCCPGPEEDSCTRRANCKCSSGQHVAEYSCGFGCFCYGCAYDSRRLAEANMTLERRLQRGENYEGSLPRVQAINNQADFNQVMQSWGTLAPESVLDVLKEEFAEKSAVLERGAEATFPEPDFKCADSTPLCDVSNARSGADSSNYVTTANIASWVTSVDQYIGTDRTAGDVEDVAWVLQVPSLFTGQTTIRSRWPGFIPYLVTTDDECEALTRVASAVDVFATEEVCNTNNITLSARVRYYKTEEDVKSGTFQMAKLRQQVACSDFRASGDMYLSVQNTTENIMPKFHIPKKQGGYVQPLILYGQSPVREDATLQPCASKAPMSWKGPITFELVKVAGPKMRQKVHTIYSEIVASGTDETGDNRTLTPGRYVYKVDARTGDILTGTTTPPPASGESSFSGFPWWVWLLLACLLCLLCLCGVAALYAMNSKPAPKNKKRSVVKTTPAPVQETTTPRVERAPLLAPMPYQPTMVMPQPALQTVPQPMPQYSFAIPAPMAQQTAAIPVQRSMPMAMPVAAPMAAPVAMPMQQPMSAFDMLDRNHDGKLSRDEFNAAVQAMRR